MALLTLQIYFGETMPFWVTQLLSGTPRAGASRNPWARLEGRWHVSGDMDCFQSGPWICFVELPVGHMIICWNLRSSNGHGQAIFHGRKSLVSCRFSLKPIHWLMGWKADAVAYAFIDLRSLRGLQPKQAPRKRGIRTGGWMFLESTKRATWASTKGDVLRFHQKHVGFFSATETLEKAINLTDKGFDTDIGAEFRGLFLKVPNMSSNSVSGHISGQSRSTSLDRLLALD